MSFNFEQFNPFAQHGETKRGGKEPTAEELRNMELRKLEEQFTHCGLELGRIRANIKSVESSLEKLDPSSETHKLAEEELNRLKEERESLKEKVELLKMTITLLENGVKISAIKKTSEK